MPTKRTEKFTSEPLRLYLDERFAKVFGSITSNILNREGENTIRSIVVTSAVRGEGVSTIALNYAAVSATSESMKVLLIDANLRHPSLHRALDAENSKGFSDILFSDIKPAQAVLKTSIENLHFLPAGQFQANLNRVFSKTAVKQAISGLNDQYDFIIMDSPAVSAFPDAATIAGAVDGVLMVISAHRTRREVIAESTKCLENTGAHILGSILNKRTYVIPERLYRRL
ncbi:MAG: hypothetical protein CO189_00040 [candidate division Zixibacteria bacterium CG_4_9_14_3_um_filter_46_8]|nr:MAG: hypothetical protein CO189_00040 [candidate division Zixibacteria bacterium CG_4_9_14_3_um_filter_46_8]